jgi:hypothetical protein
MFSSSIASLVLALVIGASAALVNARSAPDNASCDTASCPFCDTGISPATPTAASPTNHPGLPSVK